MISPLRWRALLTSVAFVALLSVPTAWAGKIEGLEGSVTALAFSPDGKTLAAADGGSALSLWDVASGALKTKLTGLASGSGRICWSPDARTVYGTTGNDWIAWDVASGKERLKIAGQMTRTAPNLIALSKDGRMLAAVGRGMLKVWQTDSGAALGEFEPHPNYAINSVAFSPDGRYVVTTSNDRKAQFTEIPGGGTGATFPCGSKMVSAEFSPDGKTLYVVDQAPVLHQFDVASGADQPAPAMARAAKQLAVASDGSFVACAASSLEVWSTKESRWYRKHPENSAGTSAVAISADAQWIAVGDLEGRIHVWSTRELFSAK